MVHFYYLRLYSGIESVSRPLFEQVTSMKMDGNFKKIYGPPQLSCKVYA